MNWLADLYDITDQPDKADIFMFCGGEDVSPYIYKSERNPKTFPNNLRDRYEISMFKMAVARSLSIVGICRGAQLACALAGGKLVQDMDHPFMHMMTTYDGRKFQVNSMHHQMQWPYSMGEPMTNSIWKYEVLGWAEDVSRIYNFESTVNVRKYHNEIEPEIVLYPMINFLGIQYHPESMPQVDEAVKYTKQLIHSHVEQQLYMDVYNKTKNEKTT